MRVDHRNTKLVEKQTRVASDCVIWNGDSNQLYFSASSIPGAQSMAIMPASTKSGLENLAIVFACHLTTKIRDRRAG